MALREKTKRQLQEVYENHKPYMNSEDCCEELHDMCKNCEKFCGVKKHDYEECKELPCFRNWLGLAYLDWFNGY